MDSAPLEIALLASLPPQLAALLTLAGLLLGAILIQLIIRRYLLGALCKLLQKTQGRWLEALFNRRVFHRLAWSVSLIVVQSGLPLLGALSPDLTSFLQRLAGSLMVIVVLTALGAAIAAAGDIYERTTISRERPIKGFLQAGTLILYFLGAIVAVGILIDRSPWLLVSGLGVMASVVMLVFQDTILSFVAGTQLTTNKLIRVGDWIEMPEFGADGDVIDITLNTVMVQNFDRTVTAIPAHTFLKNSFKNWRGMQESGTRRIKRAMRVDMNTIRFLSEEEIGRFSRFVLLHEYMRAKEVEIERYNSEHTPDPGFIANARRLTNIGTFRAYIVNYLRQHPGIAQNATFLVRQLEPTPQGLPLEIYVFTNTSVWAQYEGIQSDIFDHLLAIVPEFGLRLYQEPAGADLSAFFGGGTSGHRGAPSASLQVGGAD